MKKYTLCHCKNEPNKLENITWEDFEQIMRRRGVRDASIFPILDLLSKEALMKRDIIGLIEKDWNLDSVQIDYCLIDHEKDNEIHPCLVFYDLTPKSKTSKKITFSFLKKYVHCYFTKDDIFQIHERDLKLIDSDKI